MEHDEPSLCSTEIPETGELDTFLRGVAAAPSIPLPLSELQPGERIDETFEIVGLLGAGGMGVVYEAKDLSLDRRVAIKLHLHGRYESSVSPMLREAQTMARVRHPNVITVHAVGTHESALFIAMEYVGGGTLRQWLAARTRTVSEILDVFAAAAEGVAAAHRVGLVHRDFKPDNVLMDDGDRPRVADFGIARVASSFEAVDATATTLQEGVPLRSSATASRAGGLVGTPAYASPEQLRGDAADARSDQFSFFVALYQALYGQLPFELDPLVTLAERIADGRFAALDPVRARRVPRAVRAVVLRGLSPDRAQRFGSMDAALAALRRARVRPRRIAIASISVAGVVAAGWLATSSRDHAAANDCSDAQSQLADVWSDARKQELERAMVPSGDPAAIDRFVALADSVDAYASQWAVEWRQACASATAGPCLSSARGRLHKLLTFLVQAGTPVLPFATDAIEQLPDPTACVSGEAESTAADDAIEEQLEARLYDARLRYIAQPAADDIRELVSIADDAEAAGYAAIGSHALAQAGERLSEHDRPKEAEAVLRRAATLAVTSGDRNVMVNAWSLLASVLAEEHDPEEAIEKLELARGAASEVDDLHQLAVLAHNGAFALSAAGRTDEAIASFERAVELNTQFYGPQHREVAASRAALGMELREAGRTDEARAQLEQALVVVKETGGDHHHTMGGIQQSLGQLCMAAGDLECAEEHLVHARLVYESAYGPDGNPALRVVSDLASLRRLQGRIDEALAMTQLVYDRGKAAGHAPSTAFGRAAGNLAVMRASSGDWAGALTLAEQSRATFVAAVGERDPYLVHADTTLGTILRELGRLEDSRTALSKAYELAVKVLPVRDRARINSAIELGHTYVALGDGDAAATMAEEALAALADPPGPPPVVAEAEFLLARALGPASSQARDRARRALAIYDELGDATTAATIRAWIDAAD